MCGNELGPSEDSDSDMFSDDDQSTDTTDYHSDDYSVEYFKNPSGQKVLGRDCYRSVEIKSVDKVPVDIDGWCVYSVASRTY